MIVSLIYVISAIVFEKLIAFFVIGSRGVNSISNLGVRSNINLTVAVNWSLHN